MAQRPATQQPTEQLIDFSTGLPASPPAPGSHGASPPAPATEPLAAPAPASPDARFSQADLDRILANRLAEERAKFKDYDDLKKSAAKLADLETAQQTAEERLRTEHAAAQARLAALETEVATERIRSTITAEAAKRGFADPLDAYRLVDHAAIRVGDDGTVNNVVEQLDALTREKPYLLRTPTPAIAATNAARGEGPPGRTDADRSADYFAGGGKVFWSGGGMRVVQEG